MLDDLEFNLYLIRHGESEINAQPDIMGQPGDVKLTSLGKQQAKLLREHIFYDNRGNKFAYDFAFSSPYTRAADTAEIVLGTNYFILAEELREYDAGNWMQCSRKRIMTDDIKLKMGYQNMGFKPPNGESTNMVERRASEWLEKEILYNQKMISYHKQQARPIEIMVFSHGMTIKSLLHYVMGFDKSFLWKIEINNTSVTKLMYGKFGWELGCVNDCAHLIENKIKDLGPYRTNIKDL